MTPELLAILAGALGAGGWVVTWWAQRTQRDHVTQVQTSWVRAGQIVRYGPVGVVSLGTRPKPHYRGGHFGAAGITDGKLVFDGHHDYAENISVPLARICHIGLTTVPMWAGWIAHRRALAVHYDCPDGWRSAIFLTDTMVELAQALADETDLPVYDSGAAREDFGPARATRMVQDIYGEWHADRDGDLYLAPDRVLFDWRDAIPLAHIRRIDTYAHRARHPLAGDLLRIEHTAPSENEPDADVHTVGFVVRGAKAWASAIQHRTTTPLEVFAGRKEKS